MTVLRRSAASVAVDPRLVCRFLGMDPDRTPPLLYEQVVQAAREVGALGQWTALYAKLPVQEFEDGLRLGPLELPGRNLKTHLNGCDSAIVFCATAGAAFDQKLAALRRFPSRQTIWDAAGSAGIEAWCDALCASFPPGPARFSPGYGDLPLSCQRELLALLQAERIGLCLTESLLMVPTKSVTAVRGLRRRTGAERPLPSSPSHHDET